MRTKKPTRHDVRCDCCDVPWPCPEVREILRRFPEVAPALLADVRDLVQRAEA
jgi:hypothetical protein